MPVAEHKTEFIKDHKRRGEWAESVFMARAAQNGLPVSKPMGDSDTFDCVVGRPGQFVAVQVKCTYAKLQTGKGYICAVLSNGKIYPAGSFDFVAAYLIPEDAWYIVPAKLIQGHKTICLSSPAGKYEQYREAWHLLREATACEQVEGDPEPQPSQEANEEAEPQGTGETPFTTRVRASFDFARRHLEKGGRS